MNLLDKTEQFVADAFEKAGNPGEISHHRRTVHWIKELKPDADEALLIAGMAHDVERAFYGDWKAGSDVPEKLKRHQELGASIVGKFLKGQQAPDALIAHVTELILHHEEGESEDQNILCDADCLAYFEEKALRNAQRFRQEGRAEEMKRKLSYVFSRISAPKAKVIAQKWFQEALSECDRK